MKVQAFYTLAELSRLGGVSRQKMQSMLRSADITTEKRGKYRVVFVSMIREKMPQLWDSLAACIEIRLRDR